MCNSRSQLSLMGVVIVWASSKAAGSANLTVVFLRFDIAFLLVAFHAAIVQRHNSTIDIHRSNAAMFASSFHAAIDVCNSNKLLQK